MRMIYALFLVIILITGCGNREGKPDQGIKQTLDSEAESNGLELQTPLGNVQEEQNRSETQLVESNSKNEDEDSDIISSELTEEEVSNVRAMIDQYDYLNFEYPPLEEFEKIKRVFNQKPEGEIQFKPLSENEKLSYQERFITFYNFPNILNTNEMTVTNKNTGEEIFHSFNVSKIYRVRERNNLIYFFVDDMDDKLGLYELWEIDGELGIIKKIIDAGLEATFSRDGKLIVYEDYDYAVQLSDEYFERDIPCLPKIYIFSTESNEIIYAKDLAELQDWKRTYYSFELEFESNNNVCIELFEERDIVVEVRIDLENDKIEIENFFENYH